MHRVFDRMKPLKRASVGLLAALIAVGPGGVVRAANVTDDANLLRDKINPGFGDSLVGQPFTQPLELLDLDVIFAPTHVDSDATRRLGPEPRLRSPLVTVGLQTSRAALTSMEKISPDASPGTPARATDSGRDGRQARP